MKKVEGISTLAISFYFIVWYYEITISGAAKKNTEKANPEALWRRCRQKIICAQHNQMEPNERDRIGRTNADE